MAKQTREQLGVKAGDKIIVKGKVSFARLDKAIDGEALVAENKRRVSMGMLAADKPFRSVAIEEPEIVQGHNTPLANFYGQSVYQAKQSGKQTMSLESKSLFPPTFGHIQDGKLVEIADPQRNPAPGQVVYLMIEAYMPKGFNKLGSSFNAVVYEEGEIKFYESGGGLSGFGQAMNLEVQNLQNQPAAQTAPAQNAPAQEQGNAGFGGQQAPQENGFGAAPVQQNAFGAQPEQNAGNAFGGQQAPANDPFGSQNAGGGSPFGAAPTNTGRGDSPFA